MQIPLDARLAVFREGFRQLDADIITLQEILTNDAGQAAEMLGPDYHLAQQSRENDRQGVTTASRWPFGRVSEIDLHVTDRIRDFSAARSRLR